MKNRAAVSLGRKGGKAKSEAKAAAARLNGQKGGRPPSIQTEYRCHICGATARSSAQVWCSCLGVATPTRMTASSVDRAVRAAFSRFGIRPKE
jgi:hypothetical protein